MTDQEQTELQTLRAIVRELGETDPSELDPFSQSDPTFCKFCEARLGSHYEDCLWLRARQAMGEGE